MKKLIYFNRLDAIDNVGVSQLTDDLQTFLSDRSDLIINPTILSDRFTFDKEDGGTGFALIFSVPNDFNN